MKCPFRTASVVKHFDRLDSVVVKQEFAECYGSECPYYFPPRTENGIIYHEECKRVSLEEATLHGERVALEEVVDIDAQTQRNNAAMRRVIDFVMDGGAEK